MAPGGPEGLVLQRDADRGQTVRLTLDDVAYLRSAAGSDALAWVDELPLTPDSRVSDVAAARRRFAHRAAALVETTLLRRRAVAKTPDAARWLFTDEALQQATTAHVARHRAVRLAGREVHDVTCSIGAELAALRPVAAALLGSDIDAVRLAMARHNVEGVAVCRADALHPISRRAVVVADPARRAGGRRRTAPGDHLPPLDVLIDTYRDRDLVVKCAPGLDFDAVRALGHDGEIEVVSLRGDVREACLWPRGLVDGGVARRATRLDAHGRVAEQITDTEPDDCPVAPAGRWIVDPDGAVVRAGLVRHYAARHGLWLLDPHIAYVSGDRLPAGVRGFEVLAEIAYSERRLRAELARLDCGSVEILVRGLDVEPAALRRRLRLTGARALSVVLTRIGAGAAARATAFVCRPNR